MITLPSLINGLPVTAIASEAFEGDYNAFDSVTVPNSITSIGAYAFTSCSLTNVFVGTGVTNIGNDAFANCDYMLSEVDPKNWTTS